MRLLYLTLLLIACLCAAGFWFAHINTRRLYVGKTDPTTGYRCAFTLGRGWTRIDKPSSMAIPGQSLDYFFFDLPKPSPIQTWIDERLLHRTPDPMPYGLKPVLDIFSSRTERFANFELQDGYPAIKLPPPPQLYQITPLETSHLLISGQPATWFVTRLDFPWNPPSPGASNGSRLYYYMLVIKVRDKPLWYAVGGMTDDAHHRQVEKEVRAIRESFRIERIEGQ